MNTVKADCAREPFTLDWADFYATYNIDVATTPITSSVWTISDGVKGREFIDGMTTTLTIDGGTQGVILAAENTIEINGGEYRDCRTIYIEVTK